MIDELQADLDQLMKLADEELTHHCQGCYGKTPMQTVLDSNRLNKENMRAT